MKIVAVVFSLLTAFIITISIMTSDIKNKRDEVKTKIEKWYVEKNILKLSMAFSTELPLFFDKTLVCITYDGNKKEISSLEKEIKLTIKTKKRVIIPMGKVKGKVKYIDCNFIKD